MQLLSYAWVSPYPEIVDSRKIFNFRFTTAALILFEAFKGGVYYVVLPL